MCRALLLVGLQLWAIQFWSATGVLSHRLDQIGVGYMALYYVIAAVVFYARYVARGVAAGAAAVEVADAGNAAGGGAVHGVTRCCIMSDATVPGWLSKVVLLSLVLLPLTFSWAIVRYRLMDVDLIFKRGVTYTLATAALAGLYFGVVGAGVGGGAYALSGVRRLGSDRRDHRGGAVVRSAEADDPGAGGPRVRPEEL